MPYITYARTGAARFLGYESTIQHVDHHIRGRCQESQRDHLVCACPAT